MHFLYELNNNPNVIKYVHEPKPTLENITEILNNVILPQYELYGYGRWVVHLKTNDDFINWCGLKYIKEKDEVDLGYRFKEEYWGKGYGYEAAKTTIDYGFNILKLAAIFAKALPENVASWKIMENAECNMLAMLLMKMMDCL